MTVADKPVIYEWSGNGINKEFDFNVRLNKSSELKVYLKSAPDEILVNGVDYEIKNVVQGGEKFPLETSTIIYPIENSARSVLSEGEKIVLVLDIPFEQKKPYSEGGITGSALEEGLDENVRMMQVLRQKLTVVDEVKTDVDTKIENVNVALTKLDEINALHDECKNYADNAQSSKNGAEEILAQIEETGIDNKANRNLDNIDWNNLDQRAKDSLGATITTYHDVVYGVAKTVAFGGDYSTFTAIDISAYADGTYYVYKVDTTNEETQEVTSSISITTTASETALQLAKIKIADGALSEVLTSLQYTTETPLQEVKEHTESSAKDIDYDETGKLNLVPFNFSKVNWSDYKTVNTNTVSTYPKDGVFFANSIAEVTYTDGGIATKVTTNIIPVKAGDSIKSTVAGKIYFYY